MEANLKLSSAQVPKHVVQQRFRKPMESVPQTPEERNRIVQYIRNYVAEFAPVPPLPLEELKEHADKLMEMAGVDARYRDFVGVLLNNELWREQLASIPFERRLLLIPKCLRIEEKCPAPFDEFGLLCKTCGLCTIQDLIGESEKLGYATLVAEGSAIVMSLIQTGKIEAIVGVSCVSVLERAFPYMEAAAIPGVAVPLLQDDCINTTVDMDWVWDYIHLTSEDKTRRLDLGSLREEVDFWFTPTSLDLIMGSFEGETEQIARQWLARSGKRWRPFLAVAAYQALREDTNAELPDDVRKIAVAVECFHKASLVHDDIEDNDAERYGESTLHEEHGVAVALNVGDLLIGEGYRLLASTKVSSEQIAAMTKAASHGQRELCRGQGAELCWARKPDVLASRQVLEIFRKKTAPAFEVALRVGAIYADLEKYHECAGTLAAYSDALGIAYQIRDDISDLGADGDTNDIEALRPTLLLAIAHEKAKGENKKVLKQVWQRTLPTDWDSAKIEALYEEVGATERATVLLETYKEEGIRCLRDLQNQNLKGLLRRVLGKIFNDTEIKGWCKEFEEKNGVKDGIRLPGHSSELPKPEPATA